MVAANQGDARHVLQLLENNHDPNAITVVSYQS